MLSPYRTAADPEISGEGTIDPLGLATLADRLADWMLPGLTARMWRPRFLTVISVAGVVLDDFEDQIAADGMSPPWLVFEWYYVESMARARDAGDRALRQIPGIQKAGRALRERIPMGASRYLKTPKVFGFHGVYKRLATHLQLVDDTLALEENGRRLARTWAVEQGYPDLVDSAMVANAPTGMIRVLRQAVADGLAAGHTVRPSSWKGDEFFLNHLAPHRLGTGEARLLRDLLLDESAAPRGEVFRLLADPALHGAWPTDKDEVATVQALRPRASGFLRARLDAIDGYEAIARRLHEAWDRMRWRAAVAPHGALAPDDVVGDARLSALAGELPAALDRARETLTESPIAREFELELGQTLQDVSTARELCETLWNRHAGVQARKPPTGKRPWFDEVQGRFVIRPGYRVPVEPPPQRLYVHPYRLASAASFLADLRAAS